MTVNSVTAYNNELYRLNAIKREDQRHAERVQEERRVKHNRELDEQARIEMNRRMNRPGQNVDRMA